MKRSSFYLISLSILSLTLLTGSCDKKVKGCTDPDSINYDNLAEKNDGSCRYEGYGVIWYGEEASAGLTADGATALTYYLDGEVVGSSAASVYRTSEPGCGDDATVSVTQDLGKSKIRTYTLSVKDQTGFEYWNTDMTFEANSCLALELTWSSRKKK
ncbi:MAG TPA: hypothetical protein VHO46_04530 [Bacteroidales bacterium]|nr:hypothetical protein [Bacteroidales bacterium]